MRRCVLILLIALLPLQSAWAAVAAYCGHEAGSQAEHLGHHDHAHAGASAGAEPGDDAASEGWPTNTDLECEQCHAGCAVLSMVTAAFTPRLAASQPATAGEAALRTLAQAPPERPQWVRLA